MLWKAWGAVGLSILLALAGCDSGTPEKPNASEDDGRSGGKDGGPSTTGGRDSGGPAPSERPDDTVTLDPNNAAAVMGMVTDVSGAHLEGAVVELAGKQVMSGPDGVFELGELTADPELPLLVTLDGYSTGRARVDVLKGESNYVKVVLAENEVMELADVAKGGEVKTKSGVAIDLPPGSVVDADGNAVNGPIEVKIALLNDRDEIAAAPGNMIAKNPDADATEELETPLESFGMVEVNLVDSQGREVNLKGDKDAALRFPLAANHPFSIGQDIPLWHYDESGNVWNLIGNGVVQDDNTFLASVSHFSWWNADQVLTKTCVIGRVLDASGNPVPAAQMSGEGRSYLGSSHAVTGDDGSFCMEARVGSTIELSTTVRVLDAAQALAVRVNTPRTTGSCGQPSSCFMIDDLVAVADQPLCDPAQCPQQPGKVACCTTDLGPCDYVVNGDCGGSADGSWDPPPDNAGVEPVPGVPMPPPPSSSDAGTPPEDAGTDAAVDPGPDPDPDPTPIDDAGIDAGTDAGTDTDAAVDDAGMDASSGGDASVDPDSSVTDGSVVDAGNDGGQVDGGGPVLDRCADATALLDFEPVSGTTVGSTLLNDWYDSGSCNAYLPGYERVYSVAVPAGATLRARAIGDGDFGTMIATECGDVINSCASGYLRSSWTNEGPQPFTVLVIVDSKLVDHQGAFTLYLSVAEETCGDYLLDGHEQCDDGNGASEDGCDFCGIEPGYACPPGGLCRAVVCGDGLVDAGGQFSNGFEQCDDHNSSSEDGCSSSCTIEPGWVCTAPGQACREIVCGDGIIDGPQYQGPGGGGPKVGDGGTQPPPSEGEECDDQNVMAEDGCSASCHIEPGFACSGQPSVCEVRPPGDLCQDPLPLAAGSYDLSSFHRDYYMGQGPDIMFGSTLAGGQLLIVSGTASFDGYALMSTAYSCPMPVSMERRIFANQPFSVAFENKNMEVPAGGTPVVLWFAADAAVGPLSLSIGSVATAAPSCGDGVVSPMAGEVCDDGNTSAADGCDGDCVREPGFSCPPEGGSCTPIACGDGAVSWPEEDCEDGNMLDADGCSASCRTEPGYLCDWMQMQCELRGNGDLCNNAQVLPSFSHAQYSMTGMTPDKLCLGGGGGPAACESSTTRWFTFVQQPGEVTNAVFQGDFGGDVDFYGMACPLDGMGGMTLGGRSMYGGEPSHVSLLNMTGNARTVWMRVMSYTNPDGTFDMAIKTGMPGCGDGMVQHGEGGHALIDGPGGGGPMPMMEGCDDMNSVGNDGCSADCQPEPGYRCPMEGGPCVAMVCGDGVIDQPVGPAFEHCDDGNGNGNDGCSSSCAIEPSYNCTGRPSTCVLTMAGDLCGNALPLPVGDSTHYIDAFTADYDDVYGGASGQTAWFTLALQPREAIALTSTATFGGYVEMYGVGAAGCAQRYYIRGDQLGAPMPMVAENRGSAPLAVFVRVQTSTFGNISGSFTFTSSVFVPTQDCNHGPCETVVCGDGQIRGTEACDDGDTQGGDGCSASCTLESTHVCSGEPSACVTALPGDSCSIAMAMTDGNYGFAGYVAEPMCNMICGGASRWFTTVVPPWHTIALHVASGDTSGSTRVFDLGAPCWVAEMGQAGTAGPSDGFDPGSDMRRALVNDSAIARTVGLAVVANGAPSSASFTLEHTVEPLGCGDGYADTSGQYGMREACDDGGHATGDGCDATCHPEPGWACDYQGRCVEVACGDAIINGDEECDDSNGTPGDGCSDSCTLEPGYLCGGEPYACHTMQSGDACENAVAFADGSYGLTDYLPDYGCHDMCSGPDRWFTLTVPAGQTLNVSVDSESLNGEVRLFDLTWNGCSGYMMNQGGDSYGFGHTGHVSWVNSNPQSSTIGVAVSQPNGSQSSGTFELGHTLLPVGCGDGFVDRYGYNGPPENCDDGNGVGADGCSASCSIEPGWVCGNQSPSQCAQPPSGDVCQTAEPLANGMYSLGGFGNECQMGNCMTDRFFTTTIAPGELLIVNGNTDAQYGYLRMWDLTSSTCGSAMQLASTYLSSSQPGQLAWFAPAGASVVLQLEASPENASFTLDVHHGMSACGDTFTDYSGSYGAPEQCDDGNNFDLDGCSSTCGWE